MHYPLFQAALGHGAGHVPGQDLWFHARYAFYAKFCAVTVLTEEGRQSFARHLDNVRKIAKPVETLAQSQATPQGMTVLDVSHFGKPTKRLDLLHQSFAQVQPLVPGARLVIVGDYNWLHDHYLQRTTAIDPKRLSCAGRSRNVADYYAPTAVFALTSEIKGQPMVLLEAALHGVPQVAFDLPGLSDQVIDGETGYLVPFGDTESLAVRLCELLQNPTRARAMGRAARDFVGQAFAVDKIVQDWRDLIDEIDAKGRLSTIREPIPDLPLKTAAKPPHDAFWDGYWQKALRHADSELDPKISFLVPVHGTENLLGRCLDSIRPTSVGALQSRSSTRTVPSTV